MWRRWGPSKDQAIGHPMLFDTSVDEGYLETIPEVDSLRSRSSTVTNALPEVPPKSVPVYQSSHPPIDIDRSSSVYSQPSPIIPEEPEGFSVPRSTSVHSEVSPLNTPQRSLVDLHRPVSPIQSLDGRDSQNQVQDPRPEARFKSQIPRKAIPTATVSGLGSQQQKAQPQNVSHTRTSSQPETKWDDYSGEPSESGKPASAKPGAPPVELQYPQLKERTRQILASLRDRDASKKSSSSITPSQTTLDSLDNPVKREAWKGQSGRTNLVDPVRNTPNPHLGTSKIPERESSRQVPPRVPVAAQSSAILSPAIIATEVSHAAIASPSLPTPSTVRAVGSQESIKPLVPLKVGVGSPNSNPPIGDDMATATLQSPFQPQFPQDPSVHEAVTVPSPGCESDRPASSETAKLTPPTTPTPQRVIEYRRSMSPVRQAPYVPNEPNSRFSWTTYATTTDESPRSVRDAPVEASPWRPTSMVPSPIVVRKRPLVPTTYPSPQPYNLGFATPNPNKVVRKPLSPEKPRTVSMITTASTTKALPQCPPEIEAGNKIATFEARMDDLARRKRNINKIIWELTDAMRRNSIKYESRKRKEVEKMVTNLNLELADIRQEEHEVGIKLHRAQRKRDQLDCYEQPTGLWIRRVTTN